MANIDIRQSEIENMGVDCIVNAANSSLRQGGGVCGAIFSAAGASTLQSACNRIGGCPVGEAVYTSGYKLPAKYIIHAVGPNFTQDESEDGPKLLRAAYINSMKLVRSLECHSVAFPLISSGSFRGSMSNSALWTIAIGAVRDYLAAYPDYEIKVYFACRGYSLVASGREVLLSPPPIRPLEGEPEAAGRYLVFSESDSDNSGFGLFTRCRFSSEGLEFNSCEQYIETKKALLFGDIEHYYLILNEPEPLKAYSLAKKIRGFDEARWNLCREEIVYNALRAKFAGSRELASALAATGNSIIVYANAKDAFLGAGLSETDENITKPENHRGENRLGKMLMKLRDELDRAE